VSAWRTSKAPFVYRRGSNVRDLRMLLVDDVLTTGSTLSECALVLKKAGGNFRARGDGRSRLKHGHFQKALPQN
jgi:hypoxanthine phosphoribosyltransferase